MPTPTPRTFAQTIESLRFGTLGDELTEALRDLTNVCATTGKAGELKLVIKLKPGNGGQIEVIDDFSVKQPKAQKGTTLMFATPENFLQRDDPRQLTLDGLRTVDNETGEIRRVVTK